MEKTESKIINPDYIDPKYIDMVARFKAIPEDRKHCVERLKLIMFKYEPWYKSHVEQLTKAEREYLQSNIAKVRTYLDEVEEKPKDPWDELEAF